MPENEQSKTSERHFGPLRQLWNLLGGLALLLGAIGVFLPVLPTTPFVLLAAFAFTRGSPKLRHWLTTHRIFGPVIADWEARGAIATPHKLFACTLMVAAFTASLVAGLSALLLTIQALCLCSATAYVLTRPSN